jgi:hypothetical protein
MVSIGLVSRRGVMPGAALLVPKMAVYYHGGSARDGWRRLARLHPGLVSGVEVVPTFHTRSPQK